MQNELLGWMRFIRHWVLWFAFWWVIQYALFGLTTFAAMPQGPVLSAIVYIATIFMTGAARDFFEKKFWPTTPLPPSPPKPPEPVARLRVTRNLPNGGKQTIFDSHPGRYGDEDNDVFDPGDWPNV